MKKRDIQKLPTEEQTAFNQARQEINDSIDHEPVNLSEHLQTFNDGVMAIIITIIVLEIQPPVSGGSYYKWLADILVFLISFFVVADFWYDLHSAFSKFIKRANKLTAILDFVFLADLSLLPVMTKWVINDESTFAVTNYGIVFLIAQILKVLILYFGTKASYHDSKVIDTIVFRRSGHRLLFTLILNIGLIALSIYIPNLAMILYLSIPLISFLTPDHYTKL